MDDRLSARAPAPLVGTQPLSDDTRRLLTRLVRRNLHRYEQGRAMIPVAVVAAVAGWMWAGALAGPSWAPQGAAVAVVAVPVAGWLLVPVVQAAEIRSWVRHGWVVGYFDQTGTQLVHPSGECWVLSDHLAVRPGRGEAGPFRRRVFAHLAAEADRAGVPIVMATRSRKLADLYQVDMPGLRLVRTGGGPRRILYGPEYQLRRDPSTKR